MIAERQYAKYLPTIVPIIPATILPTIAKMAYKTELIFNIDEKPI